MATNHTPTAGAALGNELRAGTVAKVGSTKRIQELNGMLPILTKRATKKLKKCSRATMYSSMPQVLMRELNSLILLWIIMTSSTTLLL